MYTYTYIYTYTCHMRVPSNKNFPSVIKVVTLAFIAWKNSFIFIAAYCLLLSSIFIAYLLYQTECDGRLGNQMSVYATAWVKRKWMVNLKGNTDSLFLCNSFYLVAVKVKLSFYKIK